MMMNLNSERMERVVAEAFDKVSGNRRWETAIAKAKMQIEENPYIHFTGHSVLMLSESGEIYESNGTCQCMAYRKGQPCYHRAAYKLVKRYMEAEA